MKTYIIVFIIILIYLIIFLNEEHDDDTLEKSLDTDGYIVLYDKSKEDVLKLLPTGYILLDYSYEIIGCTISTFHRDVTSSQYVYGTKYPVYTLNDYFNNGDLLAVCPRSHKTVPFLYSNPKIIKGKSVTSILFNCDLVHAGALNDFGDTRHVIQYKIAHKDDLTKLKHLDKLHSTKIGKCDISHNYEIFCRHLSLLFSYIFNHILTPYLQENQHTLIGDILLWVYGQKFYNK